MEIWWEKVPILEGAPNFPRPLAGGCVDTNSDIQTTNVAFAALARRQKTAYRVCLGRVPGTILSNLNALVLRN